MTGTYSGVKAFTRNGDTSFPSRVKTMLDSFLMRDFNPNNDTVAVLSGKVPTRYRCTSYQLANGMMTPITCREKYRAELKVAQISSCGWVDFFTGKVENYRDDCKYDEWTHFCLLPSEVEKLIDAYTAWQDMERIRQERKAIAPNYRDFSDFWWSAQRHAARAEFV